MNIQIENDFIGFLDLIHSNQYTEAVNTLHEAIKTEYNHLLEEYPKSKWSVGYIDEKKDKWITLYSISSAKAKRLIKLQIF